MLKVGLVPGVVGAHHRAAQRLADTLGLVAQQVRGRHVDHVGAKAAQPSARPLREPQGELVLGPQRNRHAGHRDHPA